MITAIIKVTKVLITGAIIVAAVIGLALVIFRDL